LVDADYGGIHLSPLFELVVEFFVFVFAGFGDFLARFLVSRSRFLQQPPIARDRELDAIGFFEIFLSERWRPRRRVKSDCFRWFVNSCFDFFLL